MTILEKGNKMFDKFTDRAKGMWRLSRENALKLNHRYIGAEHLLLGLIDEGRGVGLYILKNLNISPELLRGRVMEHIKPGTIMVVSQNLPLLRSAKSVLEKAMEYASGLGHTHIGTEHILYALATVGEETASYEALRSLGAEPRRLEEEILKFVGMSSSEGSGFSRLEIIVNLRIADTDVEKAVTIQPKGLEKGCGKLFMLGVERVHYKGECYKKSLDEAFLDKGEPIRRLVYIRE